MTPLNVHPGEVLLKDFLRPRKVTAYRVAKDTGVPHQRLSAILAGRRAITAETDLYLCAYFGLTPGYWLRMQMSYDLRKAQEEIGEKVAARVKPLN